MKWRILNSGKCGSAENMAIDEAILSGIIKGTSLPTIRFYDWQSSTASCGYNQIAEKEVDFAALQKFGFGFVRRPTGGRLVLHDHEVTYAVIVPISGKLDGNVTESYSEISRALATGLKILGIEVELEKGNLSSAHQRQEANPCFASSSRYELAYRNKKIVGSAQVRKSGVLLQHGSILLNYNQSKLANIIPGLSEAERNRLSNYLANKTIAINEILEQPASYEDAVLALTAGFEKTWLFDTFAACKDIDIDERNEVLRLMNSKYLTDEWNKRK
ncbi:MAG: lipoate--protein ligase family protein [Candidatus Cloacimonadales bacterium]|nr:lipoate--protein ligase family protein [Candidatus Cloacimonadales bacterium]